MADDPAGNDLREAAANRGLKLVKSRKRKPGVGDHGCFGLTDAGGTPLFGFDNDRLTASASEIAAYLRKGEQSTWAESARLIPRRREPAAAPPPQAEPAPKPKKPPGARAKRRPPSLREYQSYPAVPPPSAPTPVAPPEPELAIRRARVEDAEAIATLVASLGGPVEQESVAQFIAEGARAKEPVLVADRNGIAGILVWQAIRTIRQGRIGRIVMLVVAPDNRRAGIGRLLVDAAVAAMTKQGCGAIEAISDIDVRNAHGFFRSIDFQQTSYRFLRQLG